MESERPKVEGYVISTLAGSPSHWAADRSLEQWLGTEGVPGMAGIDTRMLTKKLRTRGVMLGVLKVAEEIQEDELAGKIGAIPDPSKTDLVKGVSIDSPITHPGGSTRIVIIDCGVKLGNSPEPPREGGDGDPGPLRLHGREHPRPRASSSPTAPGSPRCASTPSGPSGGSWRRSFP